MTIDKVIAAILDGGAGRLTIPGLGTFVRRGGTNGDGSPADDSRRGGTLVFMNILSGDDGTLTEAVARASGEPVVEAKVRVEKYTAGLRAALKEKRSATIEGVGTLLLTESGKYKFVPADEANRDEITDRGEIGERGDNGGKADRMDAPLADDEAAAAQKSATAATDIKMPLADGESPIAERRDGAQTAESRDVAAKGETSGSTENPEIRDGAQTAESRDVAAKGETSGSAEKPEIRDIAETGDKQNVATRPETSVRDEKPDRQTIAGKVEKRDIAAKRSTPDRTEAEAETNTKRNDAGMVGKVRKIDSGDTNTGARDVIPDGGPVVYRPNIRRTQKRKRIDPVILIAIIAIAIGVVVILYGRTVERDFNIDLNDIINTK